MAFTPKSLQLAGFDKTGAGSSSTPYGTLANPFPATGSYYYDTSGALWLLTVDTTGHLVTTAVLVTATGSPYGLLLALTKP